MHTLAKGALAIALLMSTTAASAGRAPVTSAMHIDYAGACRVPSGVSGNWDVYQEIFQAGSPTWLPAHTHDGVECTVTIRGTASWWLLKQGIIRLPAGKTFYTPEHAVHTAGNTSGEAMQYMAIHVISAGQPFRRLVDAPSAPGQVTTGTRSIFKSTFLDQPSSHGGIVVLQRLETLAPRRSASLTPSKSLTYYTVTTGSAIFVIDGHPHTIEQFQKIAIPRGVRLDVLNQTQTPVQMAVCELRDMP